MKIIGLDGKEYQLDLRNKNIKGKDLKKRSELHLETRTILKELFKFDIIYEEVTLPGWINPLYIDFFIPSRNLAIEVNGKQHYEASSLFGGEEALKKQKVRDKIKRNLLELNQIFLLELNQNERTEWREQIKNAFRNS